MIIAWIELKTLRMVRIKNKPKYELLTKALAGCVSPTFLSYFSNVMTMLLSLSMMGLLQSLHSYIYPYFRTGPNSSHSTLQVLITCEVAVGNWLLVLC